MYLAVAAPLNYAIMRHTLGGPSGTWILIKTPWFVFKINFHHGIGTQGNQHIDALKQYLTVIVVK